MTKQHHCVFLVAFGLLMSHAAFASHYGNQFASAHYCAAHPGVAICQELTELKNPDFSHGSTHIDLYPAPHRGLWGYDSGGGPGSGPPQNSTASIRAAAAAGYSLIEMDIMRTSDNKIVSSHDYPIFRTTNAQSKDQYVFTLRQSELSNLYLRRRNGTVSNQRFLTGESLIDEVSRANLIVLVDPKERIGKFVSGQCAEFCENEYFKKVDWLLLINAFLNVVDYYRALHHVVIKTTLSPLEISQGVTQSNPHTGEQRSAPGLGRTTMSQVLWVPELISSQHNDSIQRIAQVVDEWNTSTYGPMLAYIETDFFNGNDVQLDSFTRNETEYVNILGYIAKTAGIRSGLFSEEPTAQRGTYTRWAVGKLKNLPADRRANYSWVLSQPYAGYMIVTTDVPNIWTQINE